MCKPKLRGGLKMIAHTIVYVILSVLTATAVFAAGTPIEKAPKEQAQDGVADKGDKDSSTAL
jgi:hypothetical protein